MTIEFIKDIAAVLGCVLSAAGVITLFSKKAREFVKKTVHVDESSANVQEIKDMLNKHIADDGIFKQEIRQANEIALEYTKNDCRNTIKDIFYKYKDEKILPLYEKKTLMNIEELYINKLHCNSFAKYLLEEMREWEIDYENSHAEEE